MKVLISGFEPFGNDVINPSIEAVKLLDDIIDNKQVIKIEIPVVAHESLRVLEQAIDEHKPDYVICVGQAGGRKDITIERIGINIDDYRIADNKGNTPVDEPIYIDGEDAYFTTLPIKKIITELNAKNIAASISNTAGTYVCNHVTYGVQYYIRKHNLSCKSGFVHIPFIPEQNHPEHSSMELSLIAEGLACIITHIDKENIVVSEGTIC